MELGYNCNDDKTLWFIFERYPELFDIYFTGYKNIAYNQLGKNFIKNLSFLDLLFNLGKDSRRFIKKNFFLMKDKNI